MEHTQKKKNSCTYILPSQSILSLIHDTTLRIIIKKKITIKTIHEISMS